MTRAAARRAISTVRSVLCESTTRISSAHATDAIAPAMSASSSFVMMVTDSFGTGEVYNVPNLELRRSEVRTWTYVAAGLHARETGRPEGRQLRRLNF